MAKLNIKKRQPGEMPTAQEWNQLVTVVESMLNATGQNMFIDSTGVHTRPLRKSETAKPEKIKVKNVTTRFGAYNILLPRTFVEIVQYDMANNWFEVKFPTSYELPADKLAIITEDVDYIPPGGIGYIYKNTGAAMKLLAISVGHPSTKDDANVAPYYPEVGKRVKPDVNRLEGTMSGGGSVDAGNGHYICVDRLKQEGPPGGYDTYWIWVIKDKSEDFAIAVRNDDPYQEGAEWEDIPANSIVEIKEITNRTSEAPYYLPENRYYRVRRPSADFLPKGKIAIVEDAISYGDFGRAFIGGHRKLATAFADADIALGDRLGSKKDSYDAIKINADSANASYFGNLIVRDYIADDSIIVEFNSEDITGKTWVARINVDGVGADSLTCKLQTFNSSTEEWEYSSGDITVSCFEFHDGSNNLTGDVWPKFSGRERISVFASQDSKGAIRWYPTFRFDDTTIC